MTKRKLAMHQEAAKLTSPALAYRELAKLWLRKAFGAGQAFREYKAAGLEEADLAFMDASNEGINHIYGFEGYKPPTIKFNQYIDGYVFCVAMNKQTSVNPPFDTVQPLQESAAWRKKFVPKSQTKSVLHEGLEERDEKLLAALVGELTSEKRERTQEERIQTIDFVVAEIQPRLALTMSQLDKDRGFAKEVVGEGVSAEFLDSLLTQDEQETLLGECRREGDTIVREGMRGAYATALANMQRAMYNREQEQALSGIFWDLRESWTHLQHMHRIKRPIKSEKENAK